jgi:uncharacterized protein (TIGR00251 family)
MAQTWYRFDEGTGCATLTVHVQPNARNTGVAGLYGDALRIRVAAPAADNKANALLLDYLRKMLGLRAGMVSIRHGHHGRHKVIEIRGPGVQLRDRLAQLPNIG